MATVTQRPNADGTVTEMTPLNGGDNYVEVDESVSDDDTTYVKTPAGGFATRTDRYDFDWSSIGDGDTINSITVKATARLVNGVAGSDNLRLLMFDGSLTQTSSDKTLTTSYAEYTEVFSEAGLDVMPDNGADLKTNWFFGFRCVSNNLGDDDIRVTRVEVTVDYTEAPATTTSTTTTTSSSTSTTISTSTSTTTTSTSTTQSTSTTTSTTTTSTSTTTTVSSSTSTSTSTTFTGTTTSTTTTTTSTSTTQSTSTTVSTSTTISTSTSTTRSTSTSTTTTVSTSTSTSTTTTLATAFQPVTRIRQYTNAPSFNLSGVTFD